MKKIGKRQATEIELNQMVKGDFGQDPHQSDLKNEVEPLTDFEEEVVENNVEGKTWNTSDK